MSTKSEIRDFRRQLHSYEVSADYLIEMIDIVTQDKLIGLAYAIQDLLEVYIKINKMIIDLGTQPIVVINSMHYRMRDLEDMLIKVETLISE